MTARNERVGQPGFPIAFDDDPQMDTLAVREPLGRIVERYRLDAAGRAVSVTNLEGRVLSVDYGVGGLVKALHRFDGSSVTNAYDARGRLARTDYPGGAYEFAYLANDLPGSVTHGADSVVYGYDRWNLPVAVTNTAAGLAMAAAYAYDAAGNLTNRVTIAGATGYAYDAGERLTALEGPDGTTAYAYNAWNGLVETETRAGLTVGYAYDAVDRVTGLEYRDAAANLVQALEYDYNVAGMITQKVSRTASATNAVAYAYDELDRLIREDAGATAREYDFDLAGNRLAMRVIAGGMTNATVYTLGTANRLASWTGGGACEYDAAGCVTNLVRSGKPAVALEWDGQYRVTAAYTNGVLAESYGYDALDRRATVTAGGVATHFVNEGPHVMAETDAAGNLLRRYAYGPGVDDILSMTDFGGGVTNTYYYIKDLQNTVLAIRNAAGVLVETYDYDAWGNVLAVRDGSGNPLAQSAIGNRYLFQGREYSWTTGLYNFRARWYDPETGRWLSNDPIGISGGLNQYVFCENNPVIIVDPLGSDFYFIDTPRGSFIGHAAALIGNADTGYDYYSFGAKSSGSRQKLTHKHFNTLDEAKDALKNMGYRRFVKYFTTCEDDDKARAVGESYRDRSYRPADDMCLDMVLRMMDKIGLKYSDMSGRKPCEFYDYLDMDDLGDSRGQIDEIN